MDILIGPMQRMTKIRMKRIHWQAMNRHVVACLPEEACGFLCGIGEVVKEVIPVTNELHSSTRFRMDPEEQLAAMLKMDEQGFQMVGIYHSHVHGPEDPSETDLMESSYLDIAHVIWSPLDDSWQCRAYLLTDEVSIEIPVLIDSE